MENLQELFSTRIILSELLVAAITLEEGGNFVCKVLSIIFTKKIVSHIICDFVQKAF